MLAVLLENDQHSRGVLATMLRNLGFLTVKATSRFEEFVYFLKDESTPIDLIVSSQHMATNRDFSLAEFTSKQVHLDRSALVGISEHWLDKSFSPFKRQRSRMDAILARPFQQRTLHAGIASAFEHRASLRSTLVFYGSKESALQIEEEILSNRESQWKNILHYEEPKKLTQFLNEEPSSVGGILLEPDAKSAETAAAIKRFKRSKHSTGVPFAVYGQDPQWLPEFLTFLDLCFSSEYSWERVLDLLSRRSTQVWKMNYQIQIIRESIKKNELDEAKAKLKEALAWDDERWELLEFSGSLNENVEALWGAIRTQPCSPAAYLMLLKIADEKDRAKALELARYYCPRHPQLMEVKS